MPVVRAGQRHPVDGKHPVQFAFGLDGGGWRKVIVGWSRFLIGTFDRGEALPLHIFRDHAGFQKLQQVIGATRLGTHPRQFEAAEGLPGHDRPCNPAIDV